MKKMLLLLRLYTRRVTVTGVMLTVFAFVCMQWAVFFAVPDEVVLIKGGETLLETRLPGINNYIADDGNIINVSAGLVKGNGVGKSKLTVMAFGVIPVKSVAVEVVDKDAIYPSGRIIGMKLKTPGLLVVGTDVVKSNNTSIDTGKLNDIKKGDIITEINGEQAESAEMLSEAVRKAAGKDVVIALKRGNATIQKKVTPIFIKEINLYKLGIWVRDGIAGLGTMTFITENGGYFGALGHGLMDVDTEMLLPVEKGEIYAATVVGIKKSIPEEPGEIQGVIGEGNSIGSVYSNCLQGVYGRVSETQREEGLQSYKPAQRYEIKEGPATILSGLNNEVNSYDVKVTEINTGSPLGVKGFVIDVTDERLLENTGGIVQGMSGSPVIQNGKVIGAVTHVIVDNPTRGYGVFIDSMLKQTTAAEN